MDFKENVMQKNELRPLAIGLLIAGVLLRFIQNLNFAPVGALSLFAGARLRGWKAYALPLALMAITDPLLGGYSVATPLIYASFALNVWIGSRLRESESPLAIGGAAIAGGVQFFLLTNLPWLCQSCGYPAGFTGVLASYTAGVPFYWRTMGSDLFYTAAFFGLHAWLSRTVAPRERVAVQAA
jgi:hypothetical protein